MFKELKGNLTMMQQISIKIETFKKKQIKLLKLKNIN